MKNVIRKHLVWMPLMKILLVEDDVLVSTALVELLEANHYTVDLANNGQTRLDLAMSSEYSLILLDWLIPKLDGIGLCRELRSLWGIAHSDSGILR